MSFLNTNLINIYFMISTFVLGILCYMSASIAWIFYRGTPNCNVRNPSKDCKKRKQISYGLYGAPILLVVSAIFVYIRIKSAL